MRTLVLAAVCAASLLVHADQTVTSVSRGLFHRGDYWRWLYSEWDAKAERWRPYYLEEYRVGAEDGDRLTFEMRSAPAGQPLDPTPHHKFVIDFAKCARAARDPRFRSFVVELYTHSFGPDWELVSRAHDGLIFTEKFNCAAAFPRERVERGEVPDAAGAPHPVFRVRRQPPRPGSWYFLDRPGLEGVAAFKVFMPGEGYRFDLAEWGTQDRNSAQVSGRSRSRLLPWISSSERR